jgi:hypothetical protein
VKGEEVIMKIFIIVSIMIFLLSLSVTGLFAGGTGTVASLYFSIKIPDSWTYKQSSFKPQSEVTGYGHGNYIQLTPSKFSDLLLSDRIETFMEKIDDGAATAVFFQDTDYPIKNAPLEAYVKYKIDKLSNRNITLQKYTTVGKEKAVRIDANESDYYGNNPAAIYLVIHDKQPYYIAYVANSKSYLKYLPEFEQILKSFTFVGNASSEGDGNLTNVK